MRGLIFPVLLALAACGGGRSDDTIQFATEGSVCGDPMLRGSVIDPVDGPGRCGIDNPIRLTAVGDVQLSQPATINCATAAALKTWIEAGVRPAVGDTGGGLSSLRVVAHYSCRGRNNNPNARLSEHSFGNAIDIAGIGLADGTEMTVLSDWNGRYATQLRQMWRAACGPFGTVLGPEADVHHRDHFHFDVADYRSGSFCR
ncbi:MAG: extensin family protein [Pseudomonadota bacterium]